MVYCHPRVISVKSKIVQLEETPAILVSRELLDECRLRDEVEVEAHGGQLVVRAANPRETWDELFARQANQAEDAMLLRDLPASEWDEKEWEW